VNLNLEKIIKTVVKVKATSQDFSAELMERAQKYRRKRIKGTISSVTRFNSLKPSTLNTEPQKMAGTYSTAAYENLQNK
jgi:hypothetical protein